MRKSEPRMEEYVTRRWSMLRIAGVVLLLTGIGMCLATYTARMVFLSNLPPFLPPAGRELQPMATSFRVAAFGDFGAGVDSMKAVVQDFSDKVDFAICTGDMMKFAVESEYGHVVTELHEIMTCPFWAIPGNHDLKQFNSLASWHRFFGQDFYFWSYGDTLFIALNTATEKLPEEQRIFLKHTLANQRERYRRCVIFCHIPPVDLRQDASHCLPAKEAEAFREIIAGHKIDLIVSGHIHQYMDDSFAGVRLVHLPSSGQVIRDPDNRMFGYAMLDFKADGTIQVKQIDVTAETGRERLEFFASTVLGNKSFIFFFGLTLIVIGSILLSWHKCAADRLAHASAASVDSLQPDH